MKNKSNMWGILVAVGLTALYAFAQNNIADDELLKMLENVGEKKAVPAVEEPEPKPVDVVPTEPVVVEPVAVEEVVEAVAPVEPVVVEPVAVEEVVEAVAPVEPVVVEPVVVEEVVKEVAPVEPVVVEPVVVEEVVKEVAPVEPVAVEEVVAEVASVEPVVNEVSEEPVANQVVSEEGDVDPLDASLLDGETEDSLEGLTSDGFLCLEKVPLEEAINILAQLSGASIIVPELPETARVSVNIKDVEWYPVLQAILDPYNYELYQKVSGSNVFVVRRRPPGAPDPQKVETFKLRYATVPNAAKLIRALLPADAKISEFASRNMLVVKTSEAGLSEVRSVLQTIDIVRQQVFIESKFMELSDGAQKDLGIDWQMLQSYRAGVNDLSSSLTQTDAKSTTTSRVFDMAGGQVEGSGAPSYVEIGNSGVFERFQSIIPSTTKTSENAVSQFSAAVLSADDFSVVLSALQENKGVNVVSNPKIIVANEEKANISIVRQEPNLKQERQQAMNDQPDTITFLLDPDRPFFEYGVKLDVTPSINTSTNITVRIKPSLTRKFGDKAAGENNTYPIIDEKTIETVFSLASGQTAAIGGLTEVTESENERKIPVLGSIPFLGRLFSWKQTVNDQRETIIFVTVGLANTQNIGAESGLPEDSELARRQIIRDRNKKVLRSQGREYYESAENDKLEDLLNVMQQKEEKRQQRRL